MKRIYTLSYRLKLFLAFFILLFTSPVYYQQAFATVPAGEGDSTIEIYVPPNSGFQHLNLVIVAQGSSYLEWDLDADSVSEDNSISFMGFDSDEKFGMGIIESTENSWEINDDLDSWLGLEIKVESANREYSPVLIEPFCKGNPDYCDPLHIGLWAKSVAKNRIEFHTSYVGSNSPNFNQLFKTEIVITDFPNGEFDYCDPWNSENWNIIARKVFAEEATSMKWSKNKYGDFRKVCVFSRSVSSVFNVSGWVTQVFDSARTAFPYWSPFSPALFYSVRGNFIYLESRNIPEFSPNLSSIEIKYFVDSALTKQIEIRCKPILVARDSRCIGNMEKSKYSYSGPEKGTVSAKIKFCNAMGCTKWFKTESVAFPKKVFVPRLESIDVHWPYNNSGSLRIPIETLNQKGELFKSRATCVLEFRLGRVNPWKKIDQTKTKGGKCKLYASEARRGFYRVKVGSKSDVAVYQ